MPAPPAPPAIDVELNRIRELSRAGRHHEALHAAESVAASAQSSRDALYLMAANQRCLHRIPDALAVLERLELEHPRFSLLYQERGYCYTSLRDTSRAIEAFSRAVHLNPALPASWEMLERLYTMAGDRTGAKSAGEQRSALKALPADILHAGSLFSDGDLSAAEALLREYLVDTGEHCEALRLLARIQHQRGLLYDAELLLEASLRLAPNYRAAHLDYIRILLERQKYPDALEAIRTVLSSEPDNTDSLTLSAAVSVGLGQFGPAIVTYRRLLAASPHSSHLHLALGHAQQSLGQATEAIASYRTAAGIGPNPARAYWSLANLRTYRFSRDEIARMRALEAAPSADPTDRCHLCFALGHACEGLGGYAESWQFYARGNSLRRAQSIYRPAIIEAEARSQIELCTAQFFAARGGGGAPEADPIFILGLPRSGSTLIEQILASHSQVEGTQELPLIPRFVLEMEGRRPDPAHPRYPGALDDLAPQDFRALGDRYLDGARPFRAQKPFFIDKMPNNFRHIGLIHLILPNAKIIDTRREPLACCFGNLKQLFAAGQEFTYSIEDIARYYRTYLELMRHWDAVLPGRILRVAYEDVVDDLERNVRRILEFCGLVYEPACVEFHNARRSVCTASSEQVRQPIFREGLSQWRNYEPWLGHLKDALGDALLRYRD